MAIYSLAQLTTVSGNAAPSFGFIASSSNSPKLFEYGINLGAATASTYGLGRPANDATPPVQTSTTAVLAENPADPTGQTLTALTWSTAPTVPTNFLRRVYLPNVIGAGIVWTFPRGITMAASRGLVNWNLAASSAATAIWMVVDE
jgi:hypothetical protein